MRRLGIIGGIGPESTVVYYRSILAAGRERFAGASPPVLINSIDVQMVLRLAEEDPVPGLRDYLLSEIGILARGGASLALIAANTPHIVFDGVRQRSPIELVSIVEATQGRRASTWITSAGAVRHEVHHAGSVLSRRVLCNSSRADRCHAHLIRSATWSASSRAVSLNGLNRHSTAPCASTRERTVLSPLAVMKTIGISCRRRINSC
jgi:hypothetical protein